MLIGRGFDVNNDGTNDIFIATHVRKEDRQAAGLLVGGLLLAGVVGYFALVIVGLVLAAILVPLWFFVINPLLSYWHITTSDANSIAMYSIGVAFGALVLALGVKRLHATAVSVRLRFAERNAAKSARQADHHETDRCTPCSGHVGAAVEDAFWVRRGEQMRGPVAKAVILDALKSRKLSSRDEWAIQPAGPWRRLSEFPEMLDDMPKNFTTHEGVLVCED